jgi:hypothetical protein
LFSPIKYVRQQEGGALSFEVAWTPNKGVLIGILFCTQIPKNKQSRERIFKKFISNYIFAVLMATNQMISGQF